jgi:hypothetical protein
VLVGGFAGWAGCCAVLVGGFAGWAGCAVVVGRPEQTFRLAGKSRLTFRLAGTTWKAQFAPANDCQALQGLSCWKNSTASDELLCQAPFA